MTAAPDLGQITIPPADHRRGQEADRWQEIPNQTGYGGEEGVPSGGELEALIDLNRRRIHPGSAILDAPTEPESVWGEGHRCLWPKGEPMLLVGPDGVGKTTLAQQLVLHRAGLRTDHVLGLPIAAEPQRVLYLACDRPAQAMRSLRRMVHDDERDLLDQQLTIWKGPLPFDLGRQPEGLTALAKAVGAGTIFLDSLKDVAADLSKEEVGARLNNAFQAAVADGIEICGLHHQRKAQNGGGKPRMLADVYGSRWITAGAGSVLMLWGEPGDLVVELDHLKQPDEQVGPHKLIHDHTAGVTTLVDHVDTYTLVCRAYDGVTVNDIAAILYANTTPTRNQQEKARRQLERLHQDGRIHKKDGARGGSNNDRTMSTYYPLTTGRETP